MPVNEQICLTAAYVYQNFQTGMTNLLNISIYDAFKSSFYLKKQ